MRQETKQLQLRRRRIQGQIVSQALALLYRRQAKQHSPNKTLPTAPGRHDIGIIGVLPLDEDRRNRWEQTSDEHILDGSIDDNFHLHEPA